MSNQSVEQPFPLFFDTDGSPLENGYIYVGTENLNAEANPVNLFWDDALTIPATNPVRTVNGYPSRNGSPGRIYVGSAHSLLIKDKNQGIVHSSLSKTILIPSERIQFDVGVTGSTSRALNDKLGEFLSVKDFGAKGDGATDDTAAIQAALTYIAANGGALFWPEGEYLSGNVSATLSADIAMIGYQAKITFSVVNGVGMQLNGYPYNMTIDGIVFDGDNVTSRCLYIVEGGKLKVTDCEFNNSYQTGAADNSGLRIEGRLSSVTLTRVSFDGHTRALGAGTPATDGTDGLLITTDGSGNAPTAVTITDVIAKNVSNGETSATTDNYNANGLRIEGKYTDYPTLTIKGGDFRSIKGSSIRTDNVARVVIQACHVYRDVAGIGNTAADFAADIDVRGPTSEISDITFEYADASSGETTLVRDVYPIGFYQHDAPVANVAHSLKGIRVQNLVTLASLKGIINADHASQFTQDQDIWGEHIYVNGTSEYFMVFPATNNAIITRRASFSKVRCSLNVGVAAVNLATLADRNFLNLEDFENTNGRLPAHFTTASEPLPVSYSGLHAQLQNVVGVLQQRDVPAGSIINTDLSTFKQFAFKSFGLNAKLIESGLLVAKASDRGLRVMTASVANVGGAQFPMDTLSQNAICLVVADYVGSLGPSAGLFWVRDAGGTVDIASLAGIVYGGTADPGAGPGANALSIWYQAVAKIQVLNRLGATTDVTMMILG